jgi:hypothetical protein
MALLQSLSLQTIAAFLYTRSIKLPWLPLMAHYFGVTYMLTLTFYIAVFSIANDWLVENLIHCPLPAQRK